jgi:hypothetical protein
MKIIQIKPNTPNLQFELPQGSFPIGIRTSFGTFFGNITKQILPLNSDSISYINMNEVTFDKLNEDLNQLEAYPVANTPLPFKLVTTPYAVTHNTQSTIICAQL